MAGFPGIEYSPRWMAGSPGMPATSLAARGHRAFRAAVSDSGKRDEMPERASPGVCSVAVGEPYTLRCVVDAPHEPVDPAGELDLADGVTGWEVLVESGCCRSVRRSSRCEQRPSGPVERVVVVTGQSMQGEVKHWRDGQTAGCRGSRMASLAPADTGVIRVRSSLEYSNEHDSSHVSP